MKSLRKILGRSLEGRDVEVYFNIPFDFSSKPGADAQPFTLLIGGTHGDERATVPILENFIQTHLETGKIKEPTAVIALLNPDGYARHSRYNGRGIDLNRNFPHAWNADSEEPAGEKPLSEPEAKILYDFIHASRPAKIVSLHWALGEIDADGMQSNALAEYLWSSLESSEKNQMQIHPYRLSKQTDHSLGNGSPGLAEGTPGSPGGTTGSLGQWCGHGLVYPNNARPAIVTLELPHHPFNDPRPDELPPDHLKTVHRHWESNPEAYLAGVEGPVHRMLAAACRFEHRYP